MRRLAILLVAVSACATRRPDTLAQRDIAAIAPPSGGVELATGLGRMSNARPYSSNDTRKTSVLKTFFDVSFSFELVSGVPVVKSQ